MSKTADPDFVVSLITYLIYDKNEQQEAGNIWILEDGQHPGEHLARMCRIIPTVCGSRSTEEGGSDRFHSYL